MSWIIKIVSSWSYNIFPFKKEILGSDEEDEDADPLEDEEEGEGEMMITINTDGDQPELIITEASVESQ